MAVCIPGEMSWSTVLEYCGCFWQEPENRSFENKKGQPSVPDCPKIGIEKGKSIPIKQDTLACNYVRRLS